MKSWIHFRNSAGLVLSCRRYLDEYSSLDKFITDKGTIPVTLPVGLEEVIDKAVIFSEDNAGGNHVTVSLKSGRITIQGEGASGWYMERKKITGYKGDPIKFKIAPKLLLEVSKKSNECGVASDRLFIDTGNFAYVTSTIVEGGEKQ